MAESGGVLAVGVLGPLEVSMDGRPVALTTGRLRTLLAVLAMSAGRTVSVDRLAAALWDEDPPDNVRRGVQTYVTRLRGALGARLITTAPAGYQLHADPERIDALRFGQLLGAATQAPDPPAEQALLEAALGLWRGTPFDGVRSGWLERSETPRLVEQYLAAVERRIDLSLADGHSAGLVAQLQELTALHPLRESLWVRLLVVLHLRGRQAEALERYEMVRVRLADELGTDPGPELRQVYADLLAGTPPPTIHSASSSAARPVVPRQLPADVQGFSGRADALKALDDLISDRGGPATNAVVISAIAGTAGVGKTALAVHWAHQVADQFPDGQLYVNLRGFHHSGQAMPPAEAIRGFLDALDVPPDRVPSNLESQIGLFRSLVAGQRMLVLLDNARDADQVRPLLPGSHGCLVVVTSRNQLTGLVATETAQPLTLDLLPADEARELLARRLGEDRIAAERRAADEIITRCSGLPLALAIIAARASVQPGFPLAAVAAQLRDARSSLDSLDAGDPAADVRAVFSWSYQALNPDAARLFRLLGLHPGPEISSPAAASLTGLPPTRVPPLLAELCAAHLLTEHTPGRYTFHDLLRAYAAELAQTQDGQARQAATHRTLDHYLHSAYTAAGLLNPNRDTLTLAPPAPGTTPERPVTYDQAMDWFAAEHPVLLAAIDLAAATGWDTHTWQLAWTVTDFLDRQARWQDLVAVDHAAVVATARLGDPVIEVRAHRDLADAYLRLGHFGEADTHLRRALDLDTVANNLASQARTHYSLADLSERRGEIAEAFGHAQQALTLFRAVDHRTGQAHALNAVGWYHARLGEHEQAIAHCQQALTLHQEHENREGQAHTWDSLGYAHRDRGRFEQAVSCYQHAIDLLRELGSRYREATTLVRLGDTHHAAGGQPDAARAAWRQALSILDELGHSDADSVRAKLDAPRARAGSSS